jgi:hypothetical protein
VAETVETPDELTAIESALAGLRPGELTVIGVEAIEEALAFLRSRLEGRERAAKVLAGR